MYYSSRPAQAPDAAKPAGAQAAGVPAGATPVSVPTGGLGGGGILNFFRSSPPAATASTGTQATGTAAQPASKPFMYMTDGRQDEHCTGTLCDLYYNSSSGKAAPAGTQQASAVPGKPGPSAVPSAPAPPTAEQIALAKAAQQRRAAQEAEQQARAKCRVANDPWHCMR